MAHGGSHTVGARIPAPDDDHMFVFGGDIIPIFVTGIEEAFGVCVEGTARQNGHLPNPDLRWEGHAGLVAPPQRTTASNPPTNSFAEMSLPISVLVIKLTPSAAIKSIRR